MRPYVKWLWPLVIIINYSATTLNNAALWNLRENAWHIYKEIKIRQIERDITLIWTFRSYSGAVLSNNLPASVTTSDTRRLCCMSVDVVLDIAVDSKVIWRYVEVSGSLWLGMHAANNRIRSHVFCQCSAMVMRLYSADRPITILVDICDWRSMTALNGAVAVAVAVAAVAAAAAVVCMWWSLPWLSPTLFTSRNLDFMQKKYLPYRLRMVCRDIVFCRSVGHAFEKISIVQQQIISHRQAAKMGRNLAVW